MAGIASDGAPPPRWFPCYIMEEAMETKLLSIETRGALYSLSLHYFHKGGLPNDERMVQRIADVPSRKWHAVRNELLQGALFTRDWRHPRWDKIIADMNTKRNQRRQASAAGVEARRRSAPTAPAAPAPALDYDGEIPF
jgi:uncharacterized protein YdaU (DUF1376 family)